MSELEFTDACTKLAEIIQANEHKYVETYGLMIATFVEAQRAGESNRMALALAKHAADEPISNSFKEHESNPDCWCEPELDGGVWVHKDLH